ncbi:hypothetical protein MKS83_19570 [Chryseobacterium sp. Y16C]|uniref:hypothetical protein n=1 Tax=Chryseobacterium sp. Y16C TaxID=2920939 RepID=UPI001F0ABA0E|nr:hypothetical protein [Chryseobacterium sp. Y16C]UMQ41572.1 hypothetical protein MKS83_19570 [Chryseobacterium sp. Y16C]
MKYYLDTVAVRRLSKELPKLKDNSYTSALVILELISGINEREFKIRKQVIKNLLECGFPIIWKLPETMKAEAFPIIEIKEKRTLGLLKICYELLRSENLETLILKTENEVYNIDFFKEWDSTHSFEFVNATSKGNEELKKIYYDERLNNGEAFENYAKQFVKSLASDSELNNYITVKGMASNYAAQASMNGEKVSEEEIHNSYNHSIDIFLEYFSLFSAKKSGELGTPAKNDYVDLNHLLYLRDNLNFFIVTDDKMILNIITKQSMTIQKFKEINGIL